MCLQREGAGHPQVSYWLFILYYWERKKQYSRSKIQSIFSHCLYAMYLLLRHYNVCFLLLSYEFQETLKHPKSQWGFPCINNRNIQCTSKAKLKESSQSDQALCNWHISRSKRIDFKSTDLTWELSWQHFSLLILNSNQNKVSIPYTGSPLSIKTP